MVDVAAVGCFASLAEARRYRPRAFLRRGFCRVDDALRCAFYAAPMLVSALQVKSSSFQVRLEERGATVPRRLEDS